MKERWIEYAKKADFNLWAEKLNVSPLTSRIIRNRDIETVEDAENYLYGTRESLFSPHLMKDLDTAVHILKVAIQLNQKIAIVSDFDDDGIFAGEILYEGISEVGGEALLFTPNRVKEGYGINESIVDRAKDMGCSIILTCDNGIAAIGAISYAKEQGFTVIVTDHHDVQYEMVDGEKKFLLPEADALLDPKQPEDTYPFKELCGAGVSFKLIQALFEAFEVSEKKMDHLYQFVAIATIADVVPLLSENRILVKEGMRKLNYTDNVGLKALISVCDLKEGGINTYTVGFVIGPCFNAVGRLSDVSTAFSLLQEEDPEKALDLAEKIVALNRARQEMTDLGEEQALHQIEEQNLSLDPVIVVRLHEVHESVVGIIAGRIKEKFYRPTFVFTDADGFLKGSGRSISGYSMIDELMKVKHLTLKAGGHKMAAGLSMMEKNLSAFRMELIKNCPLTEKEFDRIVRIDARMPLSYVNETLVSELSLLEPFGTMNPSPLFARPHFKIHQLSIVGKRKNVVKMLVSDESNVKRDAIMYDNIEGFLQLLTDEFGEAEVEKAKNGIDNQIDIAFAYVPSVNEFRGNRTVQIICKASCRIK